LAGYHLGVAQTPSVQYAKIESIKFEPILISSPEITQPPNFSRTGSKYCGWAVKAGATHSTFG